MNLILMSGVGHKFFEGIEWLFLYFFYRIADSKLVLLGLQLRLRFFSFWLLYRNLWLFWFLFLLTYR
jgi:hypothetical protein